MTPKGKTKVKNEAETRSMQLLNCRAVNSEEAESYIVEGYAARYEAYPLYDDGETVIYERFSRENFEEADKSDIIFQYDHEGKVYARTGNGSLIVTPDDEGLHVIADLGRTESARKLYEEIRAGMITKMSWRFSVPCDAYQYDKDTHTITYSRIGKIYDVSAVSIPANESTSISARNFVDGVIKEEKARIEATRALEERRLKLLERIGGSNYDND